MLSFRVVYSNLILLIAANAKEYEQDRKHEA
jgi:hypothetical protein